jgi:peptide/nickel transport system substrate-binding protein
MRRILATTTVALLAVGALAACGPSTGGGDAVVTDADVSIAVRSPIGNLNVQADATAGEIAEFVNDSLIYVDPATSELRPFLAESWEETATSVSFTLREGVTCSDGTPFTPDTVKHNFDWVGDQANASPWFGSIIPADSETTVDGQVITLEAASPVPFLAFNVGALRLVCDAMLDDPEAYTDQVLGTGLYTVAEYTAGDSVVLERRDDYAWGPDGITGATEGLPKTVTMRNYSSPSTAANLLQSGELNSAVVTGPDAARLLAADIPYTEGQGLAGEMFYNFHESQPTSDAAVRIALTQALDLDELTSVVTANEGSRAMSSLVGGPLACVYDSVTGNLPEFDVDGAAATLEEAGWIAGADDVLEKDGVRLALTLRYDNSTDARSAAAEIIAERWEAIGAEVTLDGGDGAYVGALFGPDSDPSSWTATLSLNIIAFSPMLTTILYDGPAPQDGGLNFARIDNATYDEKVAEAKEAGSQAEACELFAEAESALLADAAFVPVAQEPTRRFLSGLTSSVDGSVSIPGWALRAVAE